MIITHKKLPTTVNITIPVKPYVKRFMELNYGDPVDLSTDSYYLDKLREMIRKPNTRRDTMYSDRLLSYSTFVNVIISEDDLYRYGCELSKTDIVRFGKMMEARAKFLMRLMVGLNIAIGRPIKTSIITFQDRYLFDENVWPYQSIKKDFFRNGTPHRIDFENEIFLKVEKIFLDNMYKMGTICPKAFETYTVKNFQS